VLLALVGLVLGGATAAFAASNEYGRVHVDYRVNSDGSVDVTEDLTWHFPDGEDRHGIERYVGIRTGYQNRKDTYREYDLSEVEATSPSGAPTQVSVRDDGGAMARIRVGDPDRTVRGTQRYLLSYHLDNVVNGFSDHAEFYWNAISASNNFPYTDVTASVTGPGPVDRALCYRGDLGSDQRCEAEPGPTATFSAGQVEPREAVTVLTSMPIGPFGPLTPELHQGTVSSDGGVLTATGSRAVGTLVLGAGVTLPLLAGGLMGLLVYTRGRDEQYAGLTPGLTPGLGQEGMVERGGSPTVAVRFTPPEGVTPGLVGTVYDERADTIDVAATLVDLAARGHLTIAETEGGFLKGNDWLLTRTDTGVDRDSRPLRPYEQALLSGVFAGSGGTTVRLSSLKNTFKPTLTRVQELLYDDVTARGWFRRSPQAQRGTWAALGMAMVFAGFVSMFWLHGWLSRVASGAGMPFSPSYALAIGLITAGGITILLGRRMAARTADGSAVLAQAKGFRQYLVTAEASQIQWEEAQDIFSRYLPYAIVFGVASQWASTFQKVAEAAAAAGHTVLLPTWYVGGDFGSFGGIAGSMDSFATTAGGTFTSTPGGSGLSGFSGGGGFAGGGGGGGGGGSW
jgi:hypothetical protein